LIGVFLMLVGWLVGVVLLWTSDLWTVREKLVGTLLVPGGLAIAPLVLLSAGVEDCGGHVYWTHGVRHLVNHCTGNTSTVGQVLWVALVVLVVLAPIGSAVFLISRARSPVAV